MISGITRTRALKAQRTPGPRPHQPTEQDRAAAEVRVEQIICVFFAQARERQPGSRPKALVIDSPVGSGKTRATIQAIVADRLQAQGGKPVVFVSRDYRLAEETLLSIAKASEGRVSTGIWGGKRRIGCLREDVIEAMEKAGLSTHTLCSREDSKCAFFAECPFQARKAALNKGEAEDVILMPHRMGSLGDSLPAAVAEPHAVVIDERITGQLIHQDVFPLGVLAKHRQGDAGLEADRLRVAEVAVEALEMGKDVAGHLIEVLGLDTAASLAQAARQLCLNIARGDAQFGPATTMETVKRRLGSMESKKEKSETSRGYAAEEAQFWGMVAERLAQPRETWLHEQDPGVSLSQDGKQIELGWLEPLAWPETDLLILDGTADASIYVAILGRTHDVEVLRISEHDVGMRQRNIVIEGASTVKTSLFPDEHRAASEAQMQAAEVRKKKIQAVIKKLAGHHQKLLVGTFKALEDEAEKWKKPKNLDWLHYGAIAGLNDYREHQAALAVGQWELPEAVVRRQARAIIRELPADQAGEMDIDKPRKTITRRLAHRDGGHVTVEVKVWKNPWEAALQKQYREAELVQFYGRLRSIRGAEAMKDWQTVYFMASALPECVIVDDIIHVDDLLGATKTAKGECEGVLSALGLVASKQCKSVDAAKKLLNRKGFRADTAPEGYILATFKIHGRRGPALNCWVSLNGLSEVSEQAVEQAVREHVATLGEACGKITVDLQQVEQVAA